MTAPLVITAAEVRQLILDSGITLLSDQVQLDSTVYTPMDEAWIMGQCKDAFLDNCFAMGITNAELEDGDCNNFALWWMSMITKLHRRTPNRPNPRAAAAVGNYRTTMDLGYDHTLGVFIGPRNGVLGLRFVQTQPSVYGIITLSEHELESANNLRMA